MKKSYLKKIFKNNFKHPFWFLSSISLLIIFIFSGFEIYLRQKSTYIIKEISDSKNKILIQSNPDVLIHNTKKGRRLIPNANAIIKNHHLSKRDIKVKINSLGFRDKEIPIQKKNNEIRVLVLGDSITWGDYLQVEEVYVDRIEKYLDKLPDNRTFEVINAGVGDTGLKEQVDILMETGISVSPDIVILAFYMNDSRPPWGFQAELGHSGWLRRNSIVLSKVYNNFILWKWIKNKGKDRFKWIYEYKNINWQDNKQTFLELAGMAKYDWGAAWDPKSWEILNPYFTKLKELAEENKFRVLLVVFPVTFQVYADYTENYPQQALSEIAKKNNFYFFY